MNVMNIVLRPCTQLGFLALTVLAGACRAPVERTVDPAVDLPDQFATATDSAREAVTDEAAWWLDFDDPALGALVEEALTHNRDLHAAIARIELAEARARIAGADLRPEIAATLGATRQRQNFIGLPIPGSGGGVPSATFSNFGLGLNMSWELDLWGRLRAGERAAGLEFLAANADLEAAYQSLAARTVRAWYDLVEARMQRDLASQTAAAYRATQREIDDRASTGLGSRVDARLATSDLAAAEALVEQRAAAVEVAARQLEILLGRYPAGEEDGAASDSDQANAPDLPPIPAEVPPGLPVDLLQRRPDVAAAEQRVLSAAARTESARAALLPRLSLTASGGTASDDLDDLLDGDFRVWSLGANLLQPIFEGGRLRANVDAERAAEDEARALYAQTVLRALAEVETALAVETPLRDQEARLDEAVSAARDALRLADDRYRQGVDGLLPVLEARRRSLNNQSLRLAVRRARLEARIDLHLALGGAFEKPALAPLAVRSSSDDTAAKPEQLPDSDPDSTR